MADAFPSLALLPVLGPVEQSANTSSCLTLPSFPLPLLALSIFFAVCTQGLLDFLSLPGKCLLCLEAWALVPLGSNPVVSPEAKKDENDYGSDFYVLNCYEAETGPRSLTSLLPPLSPWWGGGQEALEATSTERGNI